MDTEKENQKDSQNNSQNDKQKFITEIEEIIDPEKKRIKEKREKEALERAKKRKQIPPFIMLSAGAVISIAMFVMHYKLKEMLIVLLCVLIIFYIAGELIKWMFDRFEAQIEEARLEEGEVIEKEPDAAIETDMRKEASEQDEKAEKAGE